VTRAAPRAPFVAVYADESCLGNGKDGDNPGAAGILIEYRTPAGTLVRRDAWIAEPATTNNRMALRSVITAFEAIGRKGTRFRARFTTDSRYIVDGMTRWVHDWARRGWRRKGGPIENVELWQRALRAAAPHAVSWHWVRGHAGHAQNEYANDLAVRAARDQSESNGLVESGFDTWLANADSGARRRQVPRLEPFPDEASFRSGPSLPHLPAESPSR
jgi:ribonuclease HI